MANSTIVEGRPCKGCPTWLSPGPRERNKRLWCSESCRLKTWRRKNTVKYRAQVDEAKRRKQRERDERGPLEYQKNCEQCGGVFTAARRDYRFCSTPCSSRARLLRIKHTEEFKIRRSNNQARRRALLRGSEDSNVVDRQEVYERDGWLCQLCFRPTLRKYDNTDPWSPTLDHIVAVTFGGAHVKENCQLAHHICNSLKSDGDFDPEALADYERRNGPYEITDHC